MTTGFGHGGNVFAVARSLGIPPGELLDFSASINPLGIAPAVRKAMVDALDRVVHYPDDGAEVLRASLARFHGVEPEQIFVTNGSTELIYLLPRAVAGSRALLVSPSFSEYPRALMQQGWECGYLDLKPEEGFRLPMELLEERLAERWDALFLCSPNNPGGCVVSREEVGEVLSLCRRRGTFLVLDEAFMDFCEEDSAKDIVAAHGGAVVLRSLTKFFAIPGMRLGYGIAAADVIASLAAQRQPWSVNTVAQAAGLAALGEDLYRERTRQVVREEGAFLASGLGAIQGLVPFPSAVNYLLVRITGGMTAGWLRERLLERRILIRDCSNFHGLDSSYFRVAVRTREENERLLAALGEIFRSLGPAQE